jgi:hypothetical protein
MTYCTTNSKCIISRNPVSLQISSLKKMLHKKCDSYHSLLVFNGHILIDAYCEYLSGPKSMLSCSIQEQLSWKRMNTVILARGVNHSCLQEQVAKSNFAKLPLVQTLFSHNPTIFKKRQIEYQTQLLMIMIMIKKTKCEVKYPERLQFV